MACLCEENCAHSLKQDEYAVHATVFARDMNEMFRLFKGTCVLCVILADACLRGHLRGQWGRHAGTAGQAGRAGHQQTAHVALARQEAGVHLQQAGIAGGGCWQGH